MIGKIVVTGISLILVVGVVLGVVASINRHGSNDNNSADNMSASMKAVTSICAPTDYKEACVRSLSPVAQNGTTDPKVFLLAAVNMTIEYAKSGLELSRMLKGAVNDSRDQMALGDCKELLQFSIDELQSSFSMVGDSDTRTLNDRVADLTNWLSAVISYQQTCLDGLNAPEIKTAMQDGLVNTTQLTSNALAIVSGISDILATFKIPINFNAKSRRLLGTTELKSNGYPTWFSASDRKLLASRNNGGIRPNVVVAKDGSGQYKTITAALAAYPKNHKGRYVIYIKAGIYNEYITVTKDQVNVFMYGDGPRKTIVTGRKNNREGVSTYQTASFCKCFYTPTLIVYISKVYFSIAMIFPNRHLDDLFLF